jgi:hypothetical protein
VLPVGKVKDWRSEKRRRSENVGGPKNVGGLKNVGGQLGGRKRRSDWQLESATSWKGIGRSKTSE